jgi:hypothetical protein
MMSNAGRVAFMLPEKEGSAAMESFWKEFADDTRWKLKRPIIVGAESTSVGRTTGNSARSRG